MRRAFAVLFVAFLAAVEAVAADTFVFPSLRMGKGYGGPVVVDVTWASGAIRDLRACTGTLTVYKTQPVGGVGGVVLWAKPLSPSGAPTNRATLTVSTTDTAKPGTYYAELTIVEGGITDALHGEVVIEGR